MPNAKVLESKKTVVDALSDKIQNATAAVFVDYKGITVAQDTELRNQFRAAGVEYSVVKNTLTRFAANKAGYTEFDEVLNGTTSMASTTDDPIAIICTAAEIAANNHFDGETLAQHADGDHRVGGSQLPVRADVLSGIQEFCGNLIQHLAFEGNALGQDNVEGTDAVGSYHDEAVAKMIDIANFSMIDSLLAREFEIGVGQ